MKLGWLGTGRMGTAMAQRLLLAGNQVLVWNRTAAKTDPLRDQGAVVATGLGDLADCDVVFVMVTTPADLMEVLCGPVGLLSSTAELPRVIVDCSTVSSLASAQVRVLAQERGVLMVAAPISGNPHVVAAGQACIVASGPRDAFDLVSPFLHQIAKVAVYAGAAEQARLVKLASNLYLGVLAEALVEVTTLVEKGGTERAAFLEFLNATVLGSEWVRRRTPDLVERDWTPIFSHELMRKDFDLGLGTARELEVPLPVVALVHQQLQAAIGRGLRDLDFLSLYEQQADAAGLATSLRDDSPN